MFADRSGRSSLMTSAMAQAAAFLDVVGNGQGGDHDGQARFDRVAGAGRARRSLLAIQRAGPATELPYVPAGSGRPVPDH